MDFYISLSTLLSPYAVRALNSIEEIDSRFVIGIFKGNSATTIVSCYCPTNTNDLKDVEKFYKSLISLARLVPKHNFLFIAWDMNAQRGEGDSYKFALRTSSNRNGLILRDVIQENYFVCLSTKLQKDESKK